MIDNGIFPGYLKAANITPVFKKDSRTEKTNYRLFFLIYLRYTSDQQSKYIEKFLSKCQCGFRKVFNAQDCLLVMTEKWKIMLEKGTVCGALLTDLSKAFDCLPHDVLLAKLHAYGLDYQSLKILSSYLSNRKQRIRIGNFHSLW